MDTTVEVWWELEWLVPKENSMTGKAYWSRFEDGKFRDEAAVWKAWEVAIVANDTPVRMTKVSRELVAVVTNQYTERE